MFIAITVVFEVTYFVKSMHTSSSGAEFLRILSKFRKRKHFSLWLVSILHEMLI